MALRLIGVRHHSPACARLVAHEIRRIRPARVLVEGPCDMNERLSELALAHRLPIAILSFHSSEGRTRLSWTPFCSYSPEWAALEAAREVGALARFMDLPAWHPALSGVEHRYSSRRERASAAVSALCARFRVDDADALWDRIAEQPASPDELASRLAAYFEQLRAEEPAGERDALREEHMARAIAWAVADAKGGDVVAVAGGFHVPALLARWKDASPTWPELSPPEDGARAGSWLVPFSFQRLDSFSGYESGMPSPAFQQLVWESGPERAGEAMLARAARRLRERKLAVSSSDLVAAWTAARALGRLRGHGAVSRTDLLDGLASALVKDGLDAPFPWSRRGPPSSGTDPLLLEVLASFSGEERGELAKATPRPPLLSSVDEELRRHDLFPASFVKRTVELDLREGPGLAASRVLHRLRVLGVPGFERSKGPAWATDGELAETWQVFAHDHAEAVLIEAASLGATLESAAARKLEEALLAASGMAALAALLGEAVFVGVSTLSEKILRELGSAVDAEASLADLGAALARLLALFEHDALLGSAGSEQVRAVIEAAFERGLWIFEGIEGPAAEADVFQVSAVLALRDALRASKRRALAETKRTLELDAERALAVMERRAAAPLAPPALRGAAIGFLWSLDSSREEGALGAIFAAARPAALGDFLVGLFALARDEVAGAKSILPAIDSVIRELDDRDFLVAAPSLRLAFSWFPPLERERIARALLALHGLAGSDARELMALDVDAATLARGMAFDLELDALEERFGLGEKDEERGER